MSLHGPADGGRSPPPSSIPLSCRQEKILNLSSARFAAGGRRATTVARRRRRVRLYARATDGVLPGSREGSLSMSSNPPVNFPRTVRSSTLTKLPYSGHLRQCCCGNYGVNNKACTVAQFVLLYRRHCRRPHAMRRTLHANDNLHDNDLHLADPSPGVGMTPATSAR